MKFGSSTPAAKPAASPNRAVEDKTRKKRGTGPANTFTADVTFTGKEKGERFVNKHTVGVKASTIFGAIGRAVRNAMPLERKNHSGKCKWFEISVLINPDDE